MKWKLQKTKQEISLVFGTVEIMYHCRNTGSMVWELKMTVLNWVLSYFVLWIVAEEH